MVVSIDFGVINYFAMSSLSLYKSFFRVLLMALYMKERSGQP